MKEYKKWHYTKIQPAMALVTLESGEQKSAEIGCSTIM